MFPIAIDFTPPVALSEAMGTLLIKILILVLVSDYSLNFRFLMKCSDAGRLTSARLMMSGFVALMMWLVCS